MKLIAPALASLEEELGPPTERRTRPGQEAAAWSYWPQGQTLLCVRGEPDEGAETLALQLTAANAFCDAHGLTPCGVVASVTEPQVADYERLDLLAAFGCVQQHASSGRSCNVLWGSLDLLSTDWSAALANMYVWRWHRARPLFVVEDRRAAALRELLVAYPGGAFYEASRTL